MVFEAFQQGIITLIDILLTTITGIIGGLFTGATRTFLLVPPPTEIDVLMDYYWDVVVPIFGIYYFVVAVLALTGSAFVDQFTPREFMQRSLIALGVVFGGPYIAAYGIEVVNFLITAVYPEQYAISFSDQMTTMAAISTAATTGMAAVALYLFTTPAIILTFIGYAFMLGMRMLILLAVPILLAVLMLLWIPKGGVGKYAYLAASKVFQIWILLGILGIILGGFLGVSGQLASNVHTGGPELAGGSFDGNITQLQDVEESPLSENPKRDAAGIYATNSSSGVVGATASGGSNGSLAAAWNSVFTFLAGIWVTIGIVSLFLGSTISTGMFSNIALAGMITRTGMRASTALRRQLRGRRASPKSLNDRNRGSSGGEGVSSASTGGNTMSDINRDDSSHQDPATPHNVPTTDEQPPHPARQQPETQDQGIGDRIESTADSISQKGSALGDRLEERINQLGQSTSDTSGETDEDESSTTSESSSIGSATNTAVTSVSQGAASAVEKTNLAAQGGKSLYKGWKQPTAEGTLRTVADEVRTSNIAEPSDKDRDEHADIDQWMAEHEPDYQFQSTDDSDDNDEQRID